MLTYADKLRRLAAWLDNHPTIANEVLGEYEYPCISIYAYSDAEDVTDFEKFQELCRALGNFDKEGSGGVLTADHTEWRDPQYQEERLFQVRIHTSGVCERVQKVDENGTAVMVPKREYIVTDELEPVYEWKCPDNWLR